MMTMMTNRWWYKATKRQHENCECLRRAFAFMGVGQNKTREMKFGFTTLPNFVKW